MVYSTVLRNDHVQKNVTAVDGHRAVADDHTAAVVTLVIGLDDRPGRNQHAFQDLEVYLVHRALGAQVDGPGGQPDRSAVRQARWHSPGKLVGLLLEGRIQLIVDQQFDPVNSLVVLGLDQDFKVFPREYRRPVNRRDDPHLRSLGVDQLPDGDRDFIESGFPGHILGLDSDQLESILLEGRGRVTALPGRSRKDGQQIAVPEKAQLPEAQVI